MGLARLLRLLFFASVFVPCLLAADGSLSDGIASSGVVAGQASVIYSFISCNSDSTISITSSGTVSTQVSQAEDPWSSIAAGSSIHLSSGYEQIFVKVTGNSANSTFTDTFTLTATLTSAVSCCEAGQVAADTRSTCAACEPGTFAATKGMTACSSCPRGSSTNEQPGATGCSLCAVGYYTDSAGAASCTSCVLNAVTPSEGATSADMCYCPGGFWSEEKSAPSVCFICSPPGACGGKDECTNGFSGRLCAECSVDHFRYGDTCKTCPDTQWTMVFVYLGIYGAAIIVLYFLAKRTGKFASINISVNFAQAIAFMAYIHIEWPPIFNKFLFSMSWLNVDFDVGSPECTVKDVTWFMKWTAKMALPLLFFLAFLAVNVIVYIKATIWSRDSQHASDTREKWFNVSMKMMIMALIFSYLFLSEHAMKFFECTRQPDGTWTLNASPSELCWKLGTPWMDYVFFAVTAVVFYTVGLPLALLLLLLFIREDMEEESTFKRFGFMYKQYKPQYFWWELMILFRKLYLNTAKLLFSGMSNVHAVMTLLCFLLGVGLQFWFRPFKKILSNSLETFGLINLCIALTIGLVNEVYHDAVERKTWDFFLMCTLPVALAVFILIISMEFSDKIRKKISQKIKAKKAAKKGILLEETDPDADLDSVQMELKEMGFEPLEYGVEEDPDVNDMEAGREGSTDTTVTRAKSGVASLSSKTLSMKKMASVKGFGSGKLDNVDQVEGDTMAQEQENREAAAKAAVKLLGSGAELVKYGRKGKPHARFVQLVGNAIVWRVKKGDATKGSIGLNEISEVIEGRTTRVFARFPKSEAESLSFSIVAASRGLDLECPEPDVRDAWVQAIRAILDQNQS